MTIYVEKMNINTGDYNSIEIEYNAEKKVEVEEAGRKLAPFMPTSSQNHGQEKPRVETSEASGHWVYGFADGVWLL